MKTKLSEWVKARTTDEDKIAKKFKELIEDNGVSNDEIRDLAEPIRVSWREQSTAFNRAVVLMLGLVAIWLLLTEGQQKQQLQAGSITLPNTYLVQVFIPVLIAYLYLDAVVTAIKWEYYSGLHHSVMERLSPNLARSELDVFIGPRILSVAGAGTIGELWKKLSYGRVTEITLAFTGIFAMGALPVLFQIYAYWQLMLVHHYWHKPLTWVSLALSAILMACSLYIWLHFGWAHKKSIQSWRDKSADQRKIAA
jgi:hypothetical protein